MAADVKLLPLPELPRQVEGYNSDYWEAGQIEEYAADYARANVAHATAALQAEVEALRAEVGRLQQQYDERTACMIVHRGQALACSDAVRTAYSDERRRADKLAEALRLIESAKDRGFGIDYARGVAQSALLRDQDGGLSDD